MLLNTFKKIIIKLNKKFPKAIKPVIKGIVYVINRGGSYRVPSGMSEALFFSSLNEHRIRYVLLRNFENGCVKGVADDLYLLVVNEDLDKLRALASREARTGGKKIDIRTVYPLKGTALKTGSCAYFPPRLSEEIIENSVIHPEMNARIPDQKRHFLSYMFHLTYHKTTAQAWALHDTI